VLLSTEHRPAERRIGSEPSKHSTGHTYVRSPPASDSLSTSPSLSRSIRRPII